MKTHSPYDIFISYRREGGFETAQLIAQYLKHEGYKTFLDLENLREGKFNAQLISVIQGCRDFILVLPEGGLDRCSHPDDWMRRELECAMEADKNIIPVMLRGFSFPGDLPESIREVQYFNGVAAGGYNYLDASLEKLKGFLKSRRGVTWERYRRAILALAGSVVAVVGALSSVWWYNQREYGALCRDLCSSMGAQVMAANEVLGEVSDLEKAWKSYSTRLTREREPEKAAKLYQEFSALVDHYRKKERVIPVPRGDLSENERKLLRKNGVEVEDVEFFFKMAVPAFYKEYEQDLDKLPFYASPQRYAVNEESSNHFVDLNYKTIRLSAESLYVYYLGVMSSLPGRAVEPVLEKIRANLLNMPFIDADKPNKYYEERVGRINAELNELVLKSGNVVQSEQEVTHRLESFLENARKSADLQKTMESVEQKTEDTAVRRGQLAEAEGKLAAAYERALKKFTLEPQDDQWYQWGKVLRIASLAEQARVTRTEAARQNKELQEAARSASLPVPNLPGMVYTYSLDDMFTNIDKWLDKYQGYHPDGAAYVTPARQFYKAVRRGAVPCTGILVVGTRDNAPHPVLRVGDIIVERKGQPLRNIDHYGSLSAAPGEDKLKILRFAADGAPQYATALLPDGNKVQTALVELTEKE